MNYLGGVVGMYLTPNGIHHAACEMTSGGNFLCCASVFDKDAENAIVEIDRKTGSVVSVLDFQTIFDEWVQQIASWAHVNSICYMPKEHAVVASLRNIHAVVKVDWNTKEVIWLLSQPELWRDSVLADKRLQPQGQVEWFFMQHAAVQLEEDFDDCAHTVHVMVYDNHVAYRRPTEYYDGDMEHSFIVTYTIDEQAMTVQMEQRLPVEKSTMRSNAVLEYDKNRLFHMGGNRVAQGRDADGVIEEYNYETGECLSRYTVETGFFSAYRFAPDSALLEIEPMRTDTAVLGHPPLLRQMPLPWGADTAQDVLPDAEVLDVYLQEDIFYLRSRSNAVKGVYFAGQSDTYGIRFIENANPDKLVDEVMQTIPIRLDTLAAGTYDLYVDMGEHRYRKPACLVMQ
jgi:hypothetical protein